MPLPDLLSYFQPLAAERHDFASGVILQTPGVNVLALNAAYVAASPSPELRAELLTFFAERAMPPLVLSPFVWGGPKMAGQDVGGLRVGDWAASGSKSDLVVEQVSRLQLSTWAAVLAQSYEALEWAEPLAWHFAGVLEGRQDAVLLLAYAGGDPVGAGLWQPGPAQRGQVGGAMHLWGTLDTAADAPLLDTAAELAGGRVRVSLPDSSTLALPGEQVLTFTLLEEKAGH